MEPAGRRAGPTWGGIPVQQAVIVRGAEVHDDTGPVQELLVAAPASDAVVTAPAVASVEELLRLHLTPRHPVGGHGGGDAQRRALLGTKH